MKDFMLIFIGKDYNELNLSPDDMQDRMGKWWAWQGEMEKAGVLKGGHALQSSGKIISGSNRTVTDRASAEAKEVVGGYYIVSAENYDSAIDIAQGYPDYDVGGKVEVREVMVFEQ